MCRRDEMAGLMECGNGELGVLWRFVNVPEGLRDVLSSGSPHFIRGVMRRLDVVYSMGIGY